MFFQNTKIKEQKTTDSLNDKLTFLTNTPQKRQDLRALSAAYYERDGKGALVYILKSDDKIGNKKPIYVKYDKIKPIFDKAEEEKNESISEKILFEEYDPKTTVLIYIVFPDSKLNSLFPLLSEEIFLKNENNPFEFYS